jgi:three-Cys-motif partner protein
MLRRYLEVWYAKLASTGARRPGSQLNFIDAFAGPGIYADGEPGSPIVALTALVEHRAFVNWSSVKFQFYFVEVDAERCQSLEEQVAALWRRRNGGRPRNVAVRIVNKSFFDTVGDLTEISASRGGTSISAPTFAFVDPFGPSDLPIADLCSLLRAGSCEVLFNFMYDDINRFFTFENEKHRSKLMLLFDYDKFPSVEGLNAHEREVLLNQHIEDVFRRRGNFEFVRSFQMEGMTNRTLYSLFFATHRIEGLEVMKDVMWKIDPAEGRRFSDRWVDQPSLFEGLPNYGELRRLILQRLATSSMTIKEMENFVTIETDFKSSHLKTNVLKPLEQEGITGVTSTNASRRKGTFADGCTIALAREAR